jgi:hypothetical protein
MDKGSANDSINPSDSLTVGVASNSSAGDQLRIAGVFTVECRDADGNLKWQERFNNVVTNAGKHDMLDKYLQGSAYTAAFYIGLISGTVGSGTTAATDTAASHAGWSEAGGTNLPTYSNAARITPSWNAAGSPTVGSKNFASAASFNMNGAGIVVGAFLSSVATKDSATGILFSCGAFTGGNKTVAANDTLNVSYALAA